jgi:hypothetical protein
LATSRPAVERQEGPALLYSTPEEFAGVAAPFLRGAVENGESALVVSSQANTAVVRGALGTAADRVDWEDTVRSCAYVSSCSASSWTRMLA